LQKSDLVDLSFWLKVLVILALIVLIFGSLDNSDRIDELEYQIEGLENEIDYLHDYVSDLEEELKSEKAISSYFRYCSRSYGSY